MGVRATPEGRAMASLQTRVRSDGVPSYRVRWRLGGARDGEWQSETFSSQARALSFKEDVEESEHMWPRGWVKGAGYLEKDEAKETFDEVVESYFTEQTRRIARGRVKPYTVHRYRRCVETHLRPVFGKLPFVDIVPEEVADWIDIELDAGHKPKSIKNWHGVLFSVMAHGQKRMGLRSDNPCEVTELPEMNSRDARQLRFFQHQEWALFRACLRTDVHLLVDVTLATGLRWGEVSALRVGDAVARPDGSVSLHVTRAWSARAPEDEDPINSAEGETVKWKLGPPKSKRSRYVVLTGDVADRLLTHIEGEPGRAYVFVTARGNPWRYPDFHTDRWSPARREAVRRGLDKHVTPHMLRHTTVVWSLAQGVRIEVVSEMLGHASIQITYDVYGGLIDLHDPVLARAMAEAMTASRGALLPTAPTAEEIAATPVRPGRRGERRQRGG